MSVCLLKYVNDGPSFLIGTDSLPRTFIVVNIIAYFVVFHYREHCLPIKSVTATIVIMLACLLFIIAF